MKSLLLIFTYIAVIYPNTSFAVSCGDTILAFNNVIVYKEAKTLYDKDQFEPALLKVNESLQTKPISTDALNLKTRIQFALNLEEDAKSSNKEALRHDPTNIEALNLKVYLYFKKSTSDTAISALNELIRLEPSEIKHLIFMAMILNEINEYAKSLEFAAKAYRQDSTNNTAIDIYIDNLIQTKKHKEALSLIDQVLISHPHNKEYLRKRVLMLIELNSNKALIKAIDIYFAAGYTSPEFLKIKQKTKKVKSTKKKSKLDVKIKDKNIRLQILRDKIKLMHILRYDKNERNSIQQEIDALEKEIVSINISLKKLRKDFLYFEHSKKFNEALKVVNTIIDLTEEDIELLNLKIKMLTQLERDESEITPLYEQIIDMQPYTYHDNLSRAYAYFKLSKTELAIAEYKKLNELYPMKIKPIKYLIILYISNRNYTEALNEIEKQLVNHPEIAVDLLINKVEVLLRLGEHFQSYEIIDEIESLLNVSDLKSEEFFDETKDMISNKYIEDVIYRVRGINKKFN